MYMFSCTLIKFLFTPANAAVVSCTEQLLADDRQRDMQSEDACRLSKKKNSWERLCRKFEVDMDVGMEPKS